MNKLMIAKNELKQIKKLMDRNKFNINKWGDASYYTVYTNKTEYEINATTRCFPVDNINDVVYVRKCLRNRNELTFWDTLKGEFTANIDYTYFKKLEYKYFKGLTLDVWPIVATEVMSDELEEHYMFSWEKRNNATMVELKHDIYEFVKNIANEVNKLPYVKTVITEMKSDCVGMTDYLTIKFKNNNTIIIRIAQHKPVCNLHDYNVNILDKTYYDILDDVLNIVNRYE